MSQYTEQVDRFMEETGTTMTAEFQFNGPYFDGDKICRDVYRIELRRNGESMTCNFGQSVTKSQCRPYPGCSIITRGVKPTAYDVLACLQKYEVEEDVWDFADEYGYEITDRKSFIRVSKIHAEVEEEYAGVLRVFGDVMEQLREIE